jgi:hypothetical protein
MQFSINTPALLFPAITLLMLAYTNRFLALSTLIRNLHSQLQKETAKRENIHEQIKNLKRRLILIKQMQAAGIFSFFLCVLSMLFVYFGYEALAFGAFGLSLAFLLLSLALSLNEILISTRALEFELKDMETFE